MRRYLKSKNTNQSTSIRQVFWLALAVGSFFNCALISPAIAQQEEVLRTLNVTGVGVERIPATLAQVSLGVEIQGKMAAEVQQEVARRTSAVVEFLRSRNVERLQTQGISLRPNYNYDNNNNQRRLVGYIGTNTVSFRLKTEEVGKLLDESVQAGATRINNISFTATEAEISSAQKEALRKATVEAQQQAETVLKALNFTNKEIIGIRIDGANLPEPKRMVSRAQQFAVADSAEASTPVIGGEQVVNGTVTLQIRY